MGKILNIHTRSPRKGSVKRTSGNSHAHLTLAEILFLKSVAIRDDKGSSLLPESQFLLLQKKTDECSVCREQAAMAAAFLMKSNTSITNNVFTGKNRYGSQKSFTKKYRFLIPAAAILTVILSAFLFLTTFTESEQIELVSADSRLQNGTLQAGNRPLGVKLVQKRKKIGEINVSSQTRMSLVKVTGKKNKFKSTIKMHGGEADIVMNKNMQGDLLIRAGELSANVKWLKAGSVLNAKGTGFEDPLVHLRITDVKELNEDDERVRNLSIEVLRGKVQVAQPDAPGDVTELETGEHTTISLEPG